MEPLWAKEPAQVNAGENRALGVFNLTDRNLSLKPEYDALLDYLRLQAGE